MTRRLSIMLAIAVLLLVNATMGEGGAVHSIASDNGPQIAAVDDTDPARPEADTARLAVSSSPWALSDSGSDSPEIGDWGDENLMQDASAPMIRNNAGSSRRSAAPPAGRASGDTPVGALERHRHNIEELPPRFSA